MSEKIPKFYGIESKDTHYGVEYRFYSKFNGARGAWCYTREVAETHGEEHELIVKTLFKIDKDKESK